jgi:hypothetical protein
VALPLSPSPGWPHAGGGVVSFLQLSAHSGPETAAAQAGSGALGVSAAPACQWTQPGPSLAPVALALAGWVRWEGASEQ